MKVLAIVKATKESEAGQICHPERISEMQSFNQELVNAGVFLAVEGLQPSSQGVRLRFSGRNRSVIDGPFAETKELAGGFWLLQVNSMQEAVEWLKRAPFEDNEVEIRQVVELPHRPSV